MINKEYLKKKREESGYTQLELSKKLGYGKIIVGSWEQGIRSPKTDSVIKLCKLLNMDANVLLNLKGE